MREGITEGERLKQFPRTQRPVKKNDEEVGKKGEGGKQRAFFGSNWWGEKPDLNLSHAQTQ